MRCYDAAQDARGERRHEPLRAAAAEVRDLADGTATALAGRGRRLGAAVIDVVIALLAWGFVALVSPVNIFRPDPNATFIDVAMVSLAGFALFLALHGWLIASRGQTIGKAMLGLRMVRSDGSPAGFARICFARYLPTQLAATVPVVGMVYALVDVLSSSGPRASACTTARRHHRREGGDAGGDGARSDDRPLLARGARRDSEGIFLSLAPAGVVARFHAFAMDFGSASWPSSSPSCRGTARRFGEGSSRCSSSSRSSGSIRSSSS